MYWLINCLGLHKLAQESVVSLTDMTIAVDWDVKPQKNKNIYIYI